MKITNEDIGLTAIIVAIAVAALLLGIFSNWSLSKAVSIVVFIQGFATVVAIGLAGLFAYRKLNVFRTFYPHLTISQEVTHRILGDSFIHLSVTATLHNNSNVEVMIRKADFLLQQVSPIGDESVEELYLESFGGDGPRYVDWPPLEDFTRHWDENEFIVEPGESHPETFEYIIRAEVTSVLIYTYFYNPSYSQRSKSPQGWGVTTVHDTIGH